MSDIRSINHKISLKAKFIRLMTGSRLESIQERSDFIKTSSIWNYRSIVGKIVLGLVLAAMIGNMDAAPAFGKDKHKNKHDYGRYEHRGNGYDRSEHRGRKLEHDRKRYDITIKNICNFTKYNGKIKLSLDQEF